MKFPSFLFLLLLPHFILYAQGRMLMPSEIHDAQFSPPVSKVQEFYENLIAEYGQNDRYRASEIALQKFSCSKEEFCAKLYNNLAEEAVLMRNYEVAKSNYNSVLNTDFVPGYYTEGILADRAQLAAMSGLRNVAIQQEDYKTALSMHQRYVDTLEKSWRTLAMRNKLANDKIFATCYQKTGKSQKALELLAPYAFGISNSEYSGIDKEAINHLVELLKSKYSKKDYKSFLKEINFQIFSEQKQGKVHFYLKILEDKIYFQNDSANYQYRVANDEQLLGQAKAHYLARLFNSYFYQRLVK